MRSSIFILIFFLTFPTKTFALFQPVAGIEDVRMRDVAVSPLEDNLIYAAARNSLYKSEDRGATFRKVASFVDEEVQHIFFDAYLADTLYLAAARRVFRIATETERIFSAADEEVVLTAAKHNGIIYVGTTQGLYYAGEDILTWRKAKGLSATAVYSFAFAGDDVFFAAGRGVYVFDEGGTARRVFVVRESEDTEGVVPAVIKADVFDEDTLYLGTNQGVYLSGDRGGSWRKFYAPGVDRLAVEAIAQTRLERDTLYLSTAKGFFKVDLANKKASQIFEGLYAAEVNRAAFTAAGEVYLATAQGLFKSDYFTSCGRGGLESLLQGEPSIRAVQQAALRYNEVHPDKIKRWRAALKYRAFLPEVSLDYDKTITTALGATYDRYQIGPQDWGVNLKWDVGDLFWNTYEDDVDTRSRLNTQVRLDILDEVNRVYFERLRLKAELGAGSLSEEELFQKKLRLMELSAIIDGYTGGYLSRESKRSNEDR